MSPGFRKKLNAGAATARRGALKELIVVASRFGVCWLLRQQGKTAMAENSFDKNLRGFAGAALAAFSLASGSAALAANTPPHVDLMQPHLQEYPDQAQASGEQGTVLISLYVRQDGKIAKYLVAHSSGFTDLDNAAIESVLNWHFIPAVQNGGQVSDWTTVKIVYQLPEPAAPATPAAPPPS